jgi:hypothetical protein
MWIGAATPLLFVDVLVSLDLLAALVLFCFCFANKTIEFKLGQKRDFNVAFRGEIMTTSSGIQTGNQARNIRLTFHFFLGFGFVNLILTK